MSASHGATPEELDALGSTLEAQIDVVLSMISNVDTPLNSSTWTGPGREAFQGEWDDTFKPALTKLNEAFGNAGTRCKTTAENTRLALGVPAG
ncbi:MAG: hypothetical protein WA964_01825 [Ilumatobacter sp.]|uniref:WXG100 family type VII secretion target n=1 Tax=Ilumatobacter sp. TaxID=1967498 RepID=UPI003C716C7B